mmetsp:Transcript_3529/g.12011  ORF Transcript_3529/g.12011 Transcript_3529/m.12011 type:complete len:138 (-) Transcript_3529:147-560(-)
MSTLTISANARALGAVKAPAGLSARKSAAATARNARVVRVSAALSAKTLKPTGNRVLVIADAPETKTAGGILLTTGAGPGGPGSSVTGSVSAVGADVKAVKAGDKVLVNGFAGSDIELDDGSKGKFLTEDDILAVVS